MCGGDSGSRALWTFDKVPVVAAVHSGDDGPNVYAHLGRTDPVLVKYAHVAQSMLGPQTG